MKNVQKISIGLDLGTNSVGWAVVDENNELIKKNGKTLWGVRMFDEASDASGRRSFRSSRIRLKRRNERMRLLKEIFNNEIIKVDPTFFERLEDSFYKVEDKKNKNIQNLFIGDYSDAEYFEQFPTIYHLRQYLCDTEEKVDIRFVYLAIANMIKFRDNFLTPGDEFNTNDDGTIIKMFELYNEMQADLSLVFEDYVEYFQLIELNDEVFQSLRKVMLSENSKNDKKRQLTEIFKCEKKTLTYEYLIPALVGGNFNMSKLYIVKDNGYEKCDVTVVTEDIIALIEEKKSIIPELSKLFDFLINIKDIVDFYFVGRLLDSSPTLSSAMIKKYDEHKRDLKAFKSLIRRYLPSKYNECFKQYNSKELNNYPRYIGMNNVGAKMTRGGHCNRDSFYKYVKTLFAEIKDDGAKEFIEYALLKIENNSFLPRQNSDQNGSIPMQLNLSEIRKILFNQSKFYPFLNKTDETGLNPCEKIVKIFKFRVPYYVGHLNANSDSSWIVRTDEKIYPWNFDKVINLDETAKKFIENMQRKCTYLKGEHDFCLPKNSIIFSEYNCLSYLNKISINGSLIPLDLKKEIFKNIFLVKKNPTRKDLYNYIHSNYGSTELKSAQYKDLPEINCNMASYIKFKEIFGESLDANIELAENIIKDIVIFSDKSILERRLKEIYKLDKDTVRILKDLNYSGYSNLSKNLINGIKISNPETGELYGTLLDIMRNTNLNLQQVLYDNNYRLIDIID